MFNIGRQVSGVHAQTRQEHGQTRHGFEDPHSGHLYDRNPSSGELSWIETSDHPNVWETMDSAISPNGRHLYSVEYTTGQLAVFEIGSPPDSITLIQSLYDGFDGVDGLSGAFDVTISPDGMSVYASGVNEDAVAVFSRDQVTGLLTFIEAKFNYTAGISGLEDPMDLAISPDGEVLFVIGQQANSIVVFDRDTQTGRLTAREVIFENTADIPALTPPGKIFVSHGGPNIYWGGEGEIIVFALMLFGDNFESGDMSAWTAVMP